MYYTPACGRPSPNGSLSLNLLLYRYVHISIFLKSFCTIYIKSYGTEVGIWNSTLVDFDFIILLKIGLYPMA